MKNQCLAFITAIVILLSGCKKEGDFKFSKHMKELKGTWEMTAIEKGDDLVDFYPGHLTVTFEDCARNPDCFAQMSIDDYPVIRLGYNLGKPGQGIFSIGYREHTAAEPDSTLKAFLENITWWVNSIDRNQMVVTNGIVGYEMNLKRK